MVLFRPMKGINVPTYEDYTGNLSGQRLLIENYNEHHYGPSQTIHTTRRSNMGFTLVPRIPGSDALKVESVFQNSHADEIGFSKEDIIIGVNNNPIASLKDFTSVWGSMSIGTEVKFQIKHFTN